jgi:hypothetical protein
MNKLILGFLALLLVLPLFIFAQPVSGPKECCTLRTKVDLGPNYGTCDPSRDNQKVAAVTTTNAVLQQCNATVDQVCSAATGSAWAMFCLMDTVQYVTNWIFYILTVIVVIMVIYGGFVIVTGAGNPDKLTSGRQILTFALIGLALALLAKFLPSIVRFFIMR